MGLFSTRYKTVVATTAERVYPEELIPDSFLTGLSLALSEPEPPIDTTEVVQSVVFSGLGMNVERFGHWAATNYVYGTPQTGILAETGDVLKTALATAIPALASGHYALLQTPLVGSRISMLLR